MKIKKVLVLVELENGAAHQVLSTHDKKIIALNFMKIDGSLLLSENIAPITIDWTDNIKEEKL